MIKSSRLCRYWIGDTLILLIPSGTLEITRYCNLTGPELQQLSKTLEKLNLFNFQKFKWWKCNFENLISQGKTPRAVPIIISSQSADRIWINTIGDWLEMLGTRRRLFPWERYSQNFNETLETPTYNYLNCHILS